MRHLIIIVLISLPVMLLSQVIPEGYNAETNLIDLFNMRNKMFRTSNEGSIEVRGTPLLFKDCRKGSIYFHNKTKATNLLLNFNCYTDELIYAPSPGKEFILDDSSIDFFSIEDIDNNRLVFKQIFLEAEKKRVFLQVLHQDKSILYLRRMKEFIPADYTGPYNANRRYEEYKDNCKFYIKLKDHSLQQLKSREKYLLKLFEDKSSEVNEYLKKENPDLKNQDNLIQLIKFYDSLE